MPGETLYRVNGMAKYDIENRTQALEHAINELRRGMGIVGGSQSNKGTGIPGTKEGGVSPIPIASIAGVAQENAFTADGIHSPNLIINVAYDFLAPIGAKGFEIRVTPATGAAFLVNGPAYDPESGVNWTDCLAIRIVKPPVGAFTVAARHINFYGVGEWGDEFSGALTADTAPPASPSGLSIPTARVGSVQIVYDVPADLDYQETEVYKGVGDFSLFAGVLACVITGGKGEFVFDALNDSTYTHIKIRHKDKSGNYTALSSGTSIITRKINTVDLAAGAVTVDNCISSKKGGWHESAQSDTIGPCWTRLTRLLLRTPLPVHLLYNC